MVQRPLCAFGALGVDEEFGFGSASLRGGRRPDSRRALPFVSTDSRIFGGAAACSSLAWPCLARASQLVIKTWPRLFCSRWPKPPPRPPLLLPALQATRSIHLELTRFLYGPKASGHTHYGTAASAGR